MSDWREYEEGIFEILRAKAEPGAEVAADVKLPGRFSGIDRQIDIMLRGHLVGEALPDPQMIVVDCKCWSSTVNVPDVERFIGLVDDVKADFGLLVTTTGFSDAAPRRAAGARGVQVEVIPFDELEEWRPDVIMCEVCNTDPDYDGMPGMMYLDRLAPDGEPIKERIYVGTCDRCQAVHIRCECGSVTGISEFEEGESFACPGCGRGFEVSAIELDSDAVPLNESAHLRVKVL